MTEIHIGLVQDRVYDLQLGDAQLTPVIGPGDGITSERLDPEHITVGQLGRLAALLGVHPADLLCEEPSDWEAAHCDGLLAEFALAGAGGDIAGSARLLGWHPARLEAAGDYLYPPSYPRAMGVADALAEPAKAPGGGPAGYRAYFAHRTAPDPFDAAALLRLLHTAEPGTGAQTAGFASAAQAERLARNALVELVRPTPGATGPFTEPGFDTPAIAHPDLLYALDLAPAPPPAPGQGPDPQEDA